ncbi:16S rRNA (guanine(527)-N(7))-methyltransferase RsmG [Micromonospora sp. PPF5-17]|uniref:Ribosomal RNA small subunit methyltransferase G n=2 Tax=Micromonosporaceae TaxID=28056 RepID=A0ABX9WFD9_9ACTN|nr:16S rRNA (guanine(527)-N(7))-methyltransferase RsmG [Micromonospora sp. PPF5-17B]NES38089.1 16S rRNA (guanine(527)-N(7))-methyltransferase RsmG [Micromonospora solifontis]NES57865.1 16S rRNA (guanine(527)-N(7))-methyltransferase RsmG [Micromonospora sp. PPF5-6]RNL97026.1 16S rRNA (guanine(527)-N(7))-methyltransferase RsmG [Micromonospora solifontis]
MTHDGTTAGAGSGPGGTPPGPSPVQPDPTVDPVFSAEDSAPMADQSVSSPPSTPADPAFSGQPVTPAATPVAPVGAVDPVFAEPTTPAPTAAPSIMDDGDPGPGEPPAPSDVTLPPELAGAARTLFGDRLDLAAGYAELLATEGVVRGLIGPRETPRIWERHLLNCAAMAERIPEGASVIDVGSGAGLPGLVLAIARPDLTVTLVEPLARRTAFLVEAVEQLGLTRAVRVFRGRAEEAAAGTRDTPPLSADIVTARAVAALDRLAAWCLPLAVAGGRLVALKGASAAEEIAEHGAAVARLGGGEPELHRCGVGVIDPPATVVEVVRERVIGPARKKGPKRSRGGRRRGGRDRDR